MFRSVSFLLLFALALGAGAQQNAAAESPLDELLATPISTAAKYGQRMSEVPASVTVITSEEISRYGWHTLADVLSAMRGVYTSDDRNYTFLGLRGVGLPSDYNNRFLVLIDGHPITDAVVGTVTIGTTLAIDLSLFSRIELVRGPSSVMYGTGAMFGVINLITKDAQERSSLTAGAGSRGTQFGSGRAGFRRGRAAFSIAASWQETNGSDLYFEELDGIARDRDFDDYRSVLATFAWGGFRAIGLHSTRTKGVPTASWDTTFGEDERTTDARTFLGLQFAREIAPTSHVSMRAFLDRFYYTGDYPYGTTADAMWTDESVSTRTGADVQYVRDLRPNHRLTAGARWNRALRASYKWGDVYGFREMNAPFTVESLYAQSEWQPRARLTVTLGASYDRYSESGDHFTPRAALNYVPNDRTAIKFLAGQGFRLPTIYEEFFERSSDAVPLKPESVQTLELIWEQRVSSDVLLTASLFSIDVDEVIRQDLEAGSAAVYKNAGEIRSHGIELQADYRRSDGIWTYLSYSRQRATENDVAMPNASEYLIKGGISTPTSRPLQGALELLYESGRRTLHGHTTDETLIANLNMTVALTRFVSAGFTVRNLFDTTYALPGGPEHTQDAIIQNGRTFAVRLQLRGRQD